QLNLGLRRVAARARRLIRERLEAPNAGGLIEQLDLEILDREEFVSSRCYLRDVIDRPFDENQPGHSVYNLNTSRAGIIRVGPVEARGMMVRQLEVVGEGLTGSKGDQRRGRIDRPKGLEQMRDHLESMNMEVGGVERVGFVERVDSRRHRRGRICRQIVCQ